MPRISAKPESAQTGLTFFGMENNFRSNCQKKAFMDGPKGETIISTGVIEAVVVSTQLMYGPIPPIDPSKLRDKDGPLKYTQGINTAKATEQELFEAVAKNLLKNRGVIYGFFMPETYKGFSDEAKKLINEKQVFSTNFHEVSLTRAKGGFAKYLLDLEVAGLAPWEVITQVWMDNSHKGVTGDEVFGLFFSYRFPETKEEKAFVQQVKDLVTSSDGVDIPMPRVLQQCFIYDSVQAFLAGRETMPRVIGTALLGGLIQSSGEYNEVDLTSIQFTRDAAFTLTSFEEVEAQAQRLLSGTMAQEDIPTIEVTPVSALA